KGTPKEIIAKLAAALDKALDDPLVRKRLAELGGSIPAKQERTPASFARLVKNEIARRAPILKAASLPTNYHERDDAPFAVKPSRENVVSLMDTLRRSIAAER